MHDDSLQFAATLLDDAVKDRIRRSACKERPPETEFAKVVLEIAALCGGARGEYLVSEKLLFTLADKEAREYTFPYSSHAQGSLRSVLGRLAFLVNEFFHAEVSEVNSDLPAPDLSNLSVEQQKARVAAFAESVIRASAPRDTEIETKGLSRANPYGFSLVIDYITADGKKVPLHVETSNTLGRPFYFDVKTL